MTNRIWVTSFSVQGYNEYGKTFLQQWVEFNPNERIVVFYEDVKPDIQHDNIVYFNLFADADCKAFLARNMKDEARNGVFQNEDGSRFLNYRFQATKFARKIFALTSPLVPVADWTIWIDADVIFKGPVPDDFWDKHIKDTRALAHYIGRETAWNHSECGFVAYNTKLHHARQFLKEFREYYVTDDVFALPEWHDSYVFDVLSKSYEVPHLGHSFINIAEEHDEFHPWHNTFLGEYAHHLKGPTAKENMITPSKNSINIEEMMKGCKNRYEQILRIFTIYKPSSILEIGTFDGTRAIEMATEALKHKPAVHYIGFDVFDGGTPELDEQEHNAKGNVPYGFVASKLSTFQRDNPTFTYELIKGNTRETLPAYKWEKDIDFAFIDGGHSVETIRSDFENIKDHVKMIIFDDFYSQGIDIEKYGCNKIVADFPNALLPIVDVFGPQHTQLVMTGAMVNGGQGSFRVQTRNCADDSDICANVKYASTFSKEKIQKQLERLQRITPVQFVDEYCAVTDPF